LEDDRRGGLGFRSRLQCGLASGSVRVRACGKIGGRRCPVLAGGAVEWLAEKHDLTTRTLTAELAPPDMQAA
jgi:hypothetical protein